MEVTLGAITPQEIHKNCENLRKLSNSYFVLYIKSLGFHWNVTGIHFVELHTFFEDIYNELQEKLDEVAERLRTLNAVAPGNIDELTKLSTIKNSQGVLHPATMLDVLYTDYQTLIKDIQLILHDMQEAMDEGTKDLFIEHVRDFEKRLWMIRNLNTKS